METGAEEEAAAGLEASPDTTLAPLTTTAEAKAARMRALLAAGASGAGWDAEAPLQVAAEMRVGLAGVVWLAREEPAAGARASVLPQA